MKVNVTIKLLLLLVKYRVLCHLKHIFPHFYVNKYFGYINKTEEYTP
jgi:hypothetical protein